jgi:alpha-tubulin suppressor-like RCC1 family protein
MGLVRRLVGRKGARREAASTRRLLVAGLVASVLGALVPVLTAASASASPGGAISTRPEGMIEASVDGGTFHTCGIRTGGTVACWGDDSIGQSTPPAGTFIQVSAGFRHTCGIETGGGTTCWGNDHDGESTPPASTFTGISAGGKGGTQPHGFTCGIETDGTVACWGDNSALESTPPGGTFTKISAGGSHACGIATGGSVACWGANGSGQSASPVGAFRDIAAGGSHTCGIKTDGTVACWGQTTSGQSTPPSGTFTDVSAGSFHTCGIKTDGTVACWGDNGSGQATPPTGTFIEVSAGANHTCGVRTDGTVACWGFNTFGQATPLSGTFDIRAVSAGGHTCGIRTDGTVGCWGDDFNGQSEPPPGTFTQVSAGVSRTCGIRTDGTVACWGDRGDPGRSTAPPGTFTQVNAGEWGPCGVRTDGTLVCWAYDIVDSPLSGTFTEVSTGSEHLCGLRTDGSAACSGDDFFGQSTPPSGTFTQVSAGAYHNCGLRTDGTVACWGNDDSGQVSLVPSGTFTRVSAGGSTNCGLSTDGTVACWGLGDQGEASPPSDTFRDVDTGGDHSCGVKADGTAACWGRGLEGQLGGPAHFTSAPPPGAALGQPYSHRYKAGSGATYQLTSGTLPPGLTLDAATGVLSGTPTKAGTFTGVVTASTEFFSAPPATQPFSITVLPSRTITASDADLKEGNSGTTNITFKVAISAPVPAGQQVSVNVAMQDQTATAGSDYLSYGTTLTWNPGSLLTQTVPVTVTGDTTKEGTEAFFLKLSSPANAVLADASGTGTILDDDGKFHVSVGDTSVVEGDSGTVQANFPVTLSAHPETGQTVSLQVATADGTATAGTDYAAVSTPLTWNPGDALIKLINVPVNGDITSEPNETFFLNLSSPVVDPATTISDLQGKATIVNDDGTAGTAPPAFVTVSDLDVLEGNSGTKNPTFRVSISTPVPSGKTVSVNAATQDGTGSAGSDYTALATTTLTWNPGDPLAKTVPVPVTGDTRKEGTESFFLKLSSPVNAVLADTSGTGTILDDDGKFHVSVGDTAVAEGNSGTTPAKFAVTLSGHPSTGQAVSVHVATAGGTATAGGDYMAVATTLTWNPADPLTKVVSIPVAGETTVEPNETFFLNLSAPLPVAAVAISDLQARATIVNDD